MNDRQFTKTKSFGLRFQFTCPETRLRRHSLRTSGDLWSHAYCSLPRYIKFLQKDTGIVNVRYSNTRFHKRRTLHACIDTASSLQLEPARVFSTLPKGCKQHPPPPFYIGGLKREQVLCLVLSPYGWQTQISTDNVRFTSKDSGKGKKKYHICCITSLIL